MSETLYMRGWSEFQHYKDRNPPWIKLHRQLLDNFEYAQLCVQAKAVAPLLWLLASESSEGCVHGDIDALAFRLRIDSKTVAKAVSDLKEKGFIYTLADASSTLADRVQHATPETETETLGS